MATDAARQTKRSCELRQVFGAHHGLAFDANKGVLNLVAQLCFRLNGQAAASSASLPVMGQIDCCLADGLLMLGDRRLLFAVRFDQPCIKPQLRCTEASKFLKELEWLLLRKATQEPHEIFLGQAGNALELVAGKHLPV